MDTKICSKCGATWLEGQHYWSGTGKIGDPHDLAGLVCNRVDAPECINPCKGSTSGDTWEKRWGKLKDFDEELQRQNS